jgi:tetratricopeptide (TPR) repeat protein
MKICTSTQLLAATLLLAVALAPITGCNRAARRAKRESGTPVAQSKSAPVPQPKADEAAAAVARGNLLQQQGLDNIAITEFERAIAINPKIIAPYIGIAQIQQKKGNFVEAQKKFEAAANIDPRNFDAQYGNALMLQLTGKVAESVRAYLRAMDIKKDDFDANLNLATAYLQLKEPDQALPYAKTAVRLRGDSGPARVNLGAIYSALQQHDLAVIEFQQAAELMELSPELLLNLAVELGHVGRTEEMLNTLDTLIKTKPSPEAYERRASAQFRQNRLDDSLASFRKALELDDNYFPALNGVGVCLLNKWLQSSKQDLDSHEEAIRVLKRSLQIERRQQAVIDLVNRYQ